MKEIVVVKRSQDWKVYFANDPANWECGDTVAEAIGELIKSFHKEMGITITHKP